MTTPKPTDIREWTIQYVNQTCSWWVISYPSGNEIERTSISPPFVHVVEKIAYEQLKAEKYIQTSGMETEITAKDKVIIQQGEEITNLKKERDLAIAHDTQAYPTAFAYEQVCKVNTKLREQVKDYEAALKEVNELKEWCSAEGGFYESSEAQKQLKSLREVLNKWGG